MSVGILGVVDHPSNKSYEADEEKRGVYIPTGEKLGNFLVELLDSAGHDAGTTKSKEYGREVV
jgi:hypothetical protein